MKILGVSDEQYVSKYIVEIEHSEIEKVMSKTPYANKVEKLKPGQTFDLAAGYNFMQNVQTAIENMEKAYLSFAKASSMMADFINRTPKD